MLPRHTIYLSLALALCVSNAFVSCTKIFLSSAKSTRLQCQKCPSLAQNEFPSEKCVTLNSKLLCCTYTQRMKIRAYEQLMCMWDEQGSFTLLVLPPTGWVSNAANIFYKRIASLLFEKRELPYSSKLAWMRCRLYFALLHSFTQCIKGASSADGCIFKCALPPVDLVVSEF